MSKDAPCKNCSERYYGCHAECERYIAFRGERIEESRRIRAAKVEEAVFINRLYKVKYGENKSKIFRSPKK